MRILLIEHPRNINPERCNDIANTPLSSCLLSGYAAGMLKSRGHDVEIIEGHMDGLPYAEIADFVVSMKPDMLGVHMVYHWKQDTELNTFMDQMKKELAPYITAYGFYPTIAFEDILKEFGAVDSVILGEPEMTIAELAETISAKRHHVSIKGLAVRAPYGNVIRQSRTPVNDPDTLPFPVRTTGMYRIPEVNIQGSRGCYGGCTFCYINPFYGQPAGWRGRSPENIVKEIDEIISATGKRDFYFTDPNFFGSGRRGQERALALASLLRQRNIRFGIEGRVNDIHDKTIEMLVDAGLRHILIGLESGRDESLRRMNKMTTVAQNEEALRILRKHGIEPNVGFIMFEPDSTMEDVRANFGFLRRNNLLENLMITTNVLCHFQIVLKGTPAYQKLHQAGRLETSPSLPYEGTASFLHRDVALLADAMRRVTNFLFRHLNSMRNGMIIEPVGTKEKYRLVNLLVVDTFESLLKALEKQEILSTEEIGHLALRAELQIDAILKTGEKNLHANWLSGNEI